MIILTVNMVLERMEPNSNPIYERILWIDEGYVIAYLIDIYKKGALPQKVLVSDITTELKEGVYLKVAEDPLFEHLTILSASEEKHKELIENTWDVISQLVIAEPEIYYPRERSVLISQLNSLMSKATVYKNLRRYWQRGMTKAALNPDFYKCGGKGKEKTLGEKKIGRPRKIGMGTNVTEDWKKIFRVAISRYYETGKENSLKFSYEMMLKEFFHEDIYYEDGVRKVILKDEEEIPSFKQFSYWYEQEKDFGKAIIKRKGEKNFNLNHREILGDSRNEGFGPGSMYQIDATVADVYLVSRFNKEWVIGRPVIYSVIDVYSRLIVGIYVGLEGPSWVGAMMALSNAGMDKVEFCKQYGISITEDDWYSKFIPKSILGDNGEIKGFSIHSYIKNLGVRVSNAPAYRADWKGIVERHFRTIHEKVKPFAPGFIQKDFMKRGGKDYRLDSVLDLHSFTKIIIKCVLHHNSHYLSSYTRDEMLIDGNVEPIPNEIWKYGLKNNSGALRSFSEDILKLNLLPTESVTVTARGIKFKRRYYSNTELQSAGWFIKAREQTRKVNIAYDPRNLDYIYLPNEDGRGFLKCTQIGDLYEGKFAEELDFLNEHEDLELNKSKHKKTQNNINLASDIEHIVNEAKSMMPQHFNKESKREKTKKISERKKTEKEENRKSESFVLGLDEELSNINSNKDSQEVTIEPNVVKSKVDILSKLKAKQKEKLNGQNYS